MQKRVSSNEQNGKKNTPEEDSKPSKLVIIRCFGLLLNFSNPINMLVNLVDEECSNDESSSHNSSWMILFPNFDMDMVQRHVMLSSKH